MRADGNRGLQKVFRPLDRHFRTVGVDWAVVGSLALAAHGAGRLTHHLDIVTERRGEDGLVAWLESLGYETLHRSDGYSNHAHEDPDRGRIDVVYVVERTAGRLFADATRREILPGVIARVPHPEHLVAMKLLAARNDPSRLIQELADIVALLRATEIDADAVRCHFERYDQLDAWKRVRDSLRPGDAGRGSADDT